MLLDCGYPAGVHHCQVAEACCHRRSRHKSAVYRLESAQMCLDGRSRQEPAILKSRALPGGATCAFVLRLPAEAGIDRFLPRAPPMQKRVSLSNKNIKEARCVQQTGLSTARHGRRQTQRSSQARTLFKAV